MTWKTFTRSVLDSYRPHGFFAAPLFDDPEQVFKRLDEELGIEGDDAFYDDAPEMIYAALLSLDTAHALHFNIKKAGAESGSGYYKDLVERMAACCGTAVVASEQEPEEGIVTVDVSLELKAPWGSGPVQARQNFAPLRSFTDYLFAKDLLHQILGPTVTQTREAMGIDEEHGLFLFPPNPEAAEAMAAFEQEHLPDYAWSEAASSAHTPLPQPTRANIDEILKSETPVTAAPAEPQPAYIPQPKGPSTVEQVMTWVSRLAWLVCGLVVLRLVLRVTGVWN